MSGMQLLELGASDLCDTLHYLFEVDNSFVSEEAAESKSKLREIMYSDMYDRIYKYKYVSSESKKSTSNLVNPEDYPVEDDDFADIQPFDPKKKQPTKQYTPPTNFDPDSPTPFGGVLDAPLG